MKKLSENEEKDIVRSVMGAKDKREQRKIEAQLHSMSVDGVDQILNKHGVDTSKWKPKRGKKAQFTDEMLLGMRKGGCSTRDIAEATGYTIPTVRRRIHRALLAQ